MAKKLLYTTDELMDLIKNEQCIFYCAGKVTRTIMEFVSKQGGEISTILVTEKKKNPDMILGVSVLELYDYMEHKKDHMNGTYIVVSAMEKLHDEIEEILSAYDIKKVYVSDKLFNKITYINANYDLDIWEKVSNEMKLLEKLYARTSEIIRMQNDLNYSLMQVKKFAVGPCLEYLVINILDHCNLKCKGCDHFACIADPYIVSPETIHRDLDRLAEIFHGDYIMRIAIMGGEPLLHPDLLEIIKDVRNHFPYSTIRLTTNGILLLQQDQEFWDVCRNNKITIVNTKYPINLDFDKMKKKAEEENVKFMHFEGTGEGCVKTSFKKCIDLEGQNNPVNSFAECHISNYGNFLMEGKLYGCPFSCQSFRIFNKKFNQKLRLTENDFLDIYKIKDMQEVIDFAARPKFYCRYCSGKINGFEWEHSKGNINEWIED